MALQPTYGYPDALMVLAPGAEWSMLDNYDYATISWYSVNIQQPTKEACDIEIARLNNDQPLIECKNQASKLLYQTDWTSIPDVADPAVSNPYLMNQSAFLAYRSQVRQLAVTPVANPVWPTIPTAQWGTV